MDPELMQRVFTNLIMNAIQAMPTGGELTITASKTVDEILISIRDTGLGIAPEALGQIWHPLFTTKPKGQGFGLPVAERIISAHQGTINVESNIDKGSVFTIHLPNSS
jgi:signal transduction histidine kinase